jgi:hypothetical protein
MLLVHPAVVMGVTTHHIASWTLSVHSEFAVLSHQYWQDIFRMPCLWRSSKRSSLGPARSIKQVHQVMYMKRERSLPEELFWGHGEICAIWAVAPNIIVHGDSQYVSATYRAGFQISDSGKCFWCIWPACPPDFAVPKYFFWGYTKSQLQGTYFASIDDLKRIWECMQAIHKEMCCSICGGINRPIKKIEGQSCKLLSHLHTALL